MKYILRFKDVFSDDRSRRRTGQGTGTFAFVTSKASEQKPLGRIKSVGLEGQTPTKVQECQRAAGGSAQ